MSESVVSEVKGLAALGNDVDTAVSENRVLQIRSVTDLNAGRV